MSRDDVEILLRLKDGDQAAFTELVEMFERRLISYFYAMCGQRELAEDCAQEVFLRVYRAREHYSPDASAATFVFRIARNYWIDVYRAKKVRPIERSLEPALDETGDERAPLPASDAPRPEESAVARENERALRRALLQLPEGQQAVLELAVRQSLKYEEISAILGIPVGTVKSRVHAAVQTLRRLMGVPETRTTS
jgi:RNA polymerase sigma-70 factor, ECF subfamily